MPRILRIMETPQEPHNDGTPRNELQEELARYKAALEQEFDLATDATPEDIHTIRTNTASSLLQAVPQAVKRVIYLMEHADKEATQLVAAKFIIANGLGAGEIGESTDPLTALLKQLTANRDSKAVDAANEADKP